MYRIEWWNKKRGYVDQRTYLTFKNFKKQLLIHYNDRYTYCDFKIYQIINNEWFQIKHNNGVIS